MASDQLSMFQDRELGDSDNAQASKVAPASFSITRTINGSPQSVCDHWLIPVFVGEWMFGPRVQAEKVLSLENTVRKNGEFDFKIHRRGQEISHQGEYLELNIPSKLVMSWTESTEPEAESKISVQFTEEAGKTKLKLTVNLPAELAPNKDKIKKQWTARCKALAEKFK